MPTPLLLSPTTLRGLTLPNRVVVSPMCQYSARDGIANDWHFAHLAQFAIGRTGLIFTEAAAVDRAGRITHGDLGVWSDEQIAPLRRITDFVKSQGCVPAIQLAHAGRKASMQRPWHGNGPMDDSDRARGEQPWQVVAPSAVPVGEGWLVPHELTLAEIEQLKVQWRAGARRAIAAGFEVAEVHGAHGYLIHAFLSPLSNKRTDAYGGDFAGRIRLALEISAIVRAEWPADRPVFFRVSSSDGIEGGWTADETVELARALRGVGIDVIDCSSGGIAGSATAARIKRTPGFQVPFAERVRREADIRTMAVGLILDGEQAERILQSCQADLVAIGRQALFDPHWTLHAAAALHAEGGFEQWPVQYGWWLDRRRNVLDEQDAERAVYRAASVAR
ncbi:MAG: NADH:flavin oxidoreductase/NADH oxidase [Burkholderiales bacterium]|nr:NADH:flavin oxidoreductase/NADH oxidase [Burkholderiales bacterium]